MSTLIDILEGFPHAALDLLALLWILGLTVLVLRTHGPFVKALADIEEMKEVDEESRQDRKQMGERVTQLETRLDEGFKRNEDQHKAIEDKVDLGNQRSGRIQADLGSLRELFERFLIRDKRRNGD